MVRTLRPKQWSKNVLLFAGLVFAGRLRDPNALLTSVGAFAVFCGVSGAGYAINDVIDVDRDRAHDQKARRPIASGRLGRRLAVSVAVVLAALSLGASFLITPAFALATVAYVTLTTSYSLVLKNIVLVDVITLSMAYVLRAAAGAWALEVEVSEWLVLCTTLLALFVGLAKRRHELLVLSGDAAAHRASLDRYSIPLLDQLISLVSSATLICYALYTFFSDHRRNKQMLITTFPLVIYGVFRYLYLVFKRGQGGSPEDLVFSDAPLAMCIAAWGCAVVAILYWP